MSALLQLPGCRAPVGVTREATTAPVSRGLTPPSAAGGMNFMFLSVPDTDERVGRWPVDGLCHSEELRASLTPQGTATQPAGPALQGEAAATPWAGNPPALGPGYTHSVSPAIFPGETESLDYPPPEANLFPPHSSTAGVLE